jgi:hypothetical protein
LPGGFFGILHCVQDDGKNKRKSKDKSKGKEQRQEQRQELVGWGGLLSHPLQTALRMGTRTFVLGEEEQQQEGVVK